MGRCKGEMGWGGVKGGVGRYEVGVGRCEDGVEWEVQEWWSRRVIGDMRRCKSGSKCRVEDDKAGWCERGENEEVERGILGGEGGWAVVTIYLCITVVGVRFCVASNNASLYSKSPTGTCLTTTGMQAIEHRK